jgi:hypothetical protein
MTSASAIMRLREWRRLTQLCFDARSGPTPVGRPACGQDVGASDACRRRIQLVNATDSPNISAGVLKPSVLRGLARAQTGHDATGCASISQG